MLRVDASDKAVGAVLYQERPDEFGVVHEPIGFASQKFSSIASRWDAFKKEAYAAFYGVNHFAYYERENCCCRYLIASWYVRKILKAFLNTKLILIKRLAKKKFNMKYLEKS